MARTDDTMSSLSAQFSSTAIEILDEERRRSIINALRNYQETVLQKNLVILRFLVEGMESQPDPVNWQAGLAQKMRLEACRRFIGVPQSITSPRDLLSENVRAELVERSSLDGVHHRSVNPQQRADWFAAVRATIAEKNITTDSFPPADLEYLWSLASGICGPGLPYYRESQQIEFISELEHGEEERTVERVIVPIRNHEEEYNIFTFIWEDWEIAVAVGLGFGNCGLCGSYALFCRNESHNEWKWRYGVHDEECCSELYDTVEGFLGFYAQYGEQTEEDAQRRIIPLRLMIER